MEELQTVADKAAFSGDIDLYMRTRAEIENLTDEPAPSFIAPDTGNLLVDNWKDDDGNLLPESPNDMLLSNLAQSSVQPMPDTEKVEEMLRGRGYDDEDLFLAKHFHFRKEETGRHHSREITRMEVIRAGREIERKHGAQIDPHDRDQVIERYFHFFSSDIVTHRERCKQYVEGYGRYVQSFK
jgi:hypothetical protein